MKTVAWIIGAIIVVGAVLVAVLVFGPKPETQVALNTDTPNATNTPSSATEPEPIDNQPLAEGRYVEYSSEAVAASGYSESILFFHADWCPECRAFEQAIKAEAIPNGIQILEVDYDDNQDLRQQYGVTIQTTFVKVDQAGTQQSTWVGYGRDKSLDIVLENT